MNNRVAVVLLSGGQDSTTCLHWALREKQRGAFVEVKALSIIYGQKHAVELEAARKIASMAGVELEILHLGRILAGTSPLVSDNELGKYDTVEQLPGGIEPTFVPGRNALFLVLAANRVVCAGGTDLVTGVCEEDYGGYPDCRRAFIDSMQRTLGLAISGEADQLRIHTPLMNLDKGASVNLAVELGPACMEAMAWSHTCYDGAIPPCGECHACHLRARGFQDAGIEDPLLARLAAHA